MSDPHRFPFAFAPAYRLAAFAFGVTPATAWVHVGENWLQARFGPWRVMTPLSNVVDATATGPYRFAKTAGPARLAITDRGLTFATNPDRGLRIRFSRPVRGLEPTGVLRHPELTVTVVDVDGLARMLDLQASSAADR